MSDVASITQRYITKHTPPPLGLSPDWHLAYRSLAHLIAVIPAFFSEIELSKNTTESFSRALDEWRTSCEQRWANTYGLRDFIRFRAPSVYALGEEFNGLTYRFTQSLGSVSTQLSQLDGGEDSACTTALSVLEVFRSFNVSLLLTRLSNAVYEERQSQLQLPERITKLLLTEGVDLASNALTQSQGDKGGRPCDPKVEMKLEVERQKQAKKSWKEITAVFNQKFQKSYTSKTLERSYRRWRKADS